MYEFNENLVYVKDVVSNLFSLSEIKALCFDVGVDYDDLDASAGKSSKALALVTWAKRHDRFFELWNTIAKYRPTQVKPVDGIVLPKASPIVHAEIEVDPVDKIISDMEKLISELQGKLFELKLSTGRVTIK